MVCNFQAIAFSIFGIPIHWYSLAYICGILISLKMTYIFARHSKAGISNNNIEEFINYAIIGIIVGGRLGHVLFYDFAYYATHPVEIFKVWRGGMSFYGGFIGTTAVATAFCRVRHINFLKFMDLWAISAPIGLFLGRIANFINGELLGKVSEVPWCVSFRDGISRHPSQIYEALTEGFVLFIVMCWAFFRKNYRYKGRLSGLFCAGYGISRFLCEFFREPDSEFSNKLLQITWINLNQYMSLIVVVLGCWLIKKSSKLHDIHSRN